MAKNMHAQSSMEYLMLLAFILGITIVLVLIFQTYSQDTMDTIRMKQVDQLGRKLVDSVEKVYYLGEPSKITLKASLPSNVKSVSIGNKEIFFVMSTAQGNNELVYVTNINVTGSLPVNEGVYQIFVESKGSYVKIST
jgi:hypothetical protein